MAQLYYRYSTMNAGKSIEVIKVAYNYEERGKKVLALVPGIDDRYGKGKITSRVGLSREATIVNEDTNNNMWGRNRTCIKKSYTIKDSKKTWT